MADSQIISYLENWQTQAAAYFDEYDNADAMHESDIISQVLERLKAGEHIGASPTVHWHVES